MPNPKPYQPFEKGKIPVAIPSTCEDCGKDFPSRKRRTQHLVWGKCPATIGNMSRKGSAEFSNGNPAKTTATSLPALSMQDLSLSPHSYTPSTTISIPNDPRRSSMDNNLSNSTASLPPDIAAVRLNRINSELSARFLVQRDPRLKHPPSITGNGTYTHINSQKSSLYGPTQQFLPLGGPQRYQKAKRVQPELPDALNKAYEALERVLRTEDKLDREGATKDPRIRYGGLNVLGVGTTTLPTPPPPVQYVPPPPLPQSAPPTQTLYSRSPPPPPPPIDTQMGGMGDGDGAVSSTKSATATMVDKERDPRLMRRNTDIHVYGRR